MQTIKTHTKAFKAFAAATHKNVSNSCIRGNDGYMPLKGGKNNIDGVYSYNIMDCGPFVQYAPNKCSMICVQHHSFVIDKVRGSKYTIRAILVLCENSASLEGPQTYYHLNAKWDSVKQVLTDVIVHKYSNKEWERYAQRKGSITRDALAKFILYTNEAAAKERLQASTRDFARHVVDNNDFS